MRIAALLSLCAVLGCIPKARHELVQVQLDATRTALSARTAQGSQAAQRYEQRIEALLAEIARRQLQLDELAARSTLRDEELERLQVERAEQVFALARLRAELDQHAPEADPALLGEEPEGAAASRDARFIAELEDALRAHLTSEIHRHRVAEAQRADVEAFAPLVALGHGTVEQRGDATVVRISTGRLFQEGWTTLSPRGNELVQLLADGLSSLPGRRVSIEGHTDNRPVYTATFPSNWERGFSRAMAVLRALEARAVPATLSATSFAGSRPVADDTTEEGRRANRRIELVVEMDPTLLGAFEPTVAPE